MKVSGGWNAMKVNNYNFHSFVNFVLLVSEEHAVREPSLLEEICHADELE